ncbi:malto-oligosyltrehalose synthase [Microbacterium wangruii]|uniref:malto-oligosyltrehalose synthase n=1 Tax=Microbacterium wangruii TaxID=3049073 RepID=UPI00256F590C|nr:malto-oligosyltrehalose synthase [Microbacterium sp. zg-Y1211]MDL5487531.1 malto-oligosyltrehalose synthase [Microbacterium sp. zg-Y1211]
MTPATSTYRLQIRPSFDLDAAADLTGYLRRLGVDWAYLSPLLRATTGSDHGYDVVDPTLVDPARGGAQGLHRFAGAARAAGLGILIDIVPNHMGISQPAENPWWWDVLRRGRESEHAGAFDIDWEYGQGRVRVPILGAEPAEVITAGEIVVDADADVVRYHEHALPLAPGSLDGLDPADVAAVLALQNWELIFWRREAAELNYRRFFAVTTLAGLRVEDPEVFERSHAEILRWVREDLVDGLRVDHPDGLADPGAYLDRLAAATGDLPVLVEKILEHAATDHPEALPGWWRTTGTTGYDAMAEIDRLLIDPAGEAGLDRLDAALRAESGLPPLTGYADLMHDTKRMIADTIQQAEIARLVRTLRAEAAGEAAAADPALADDVQVTDALAELLANFPVYRSYLPAGIEHLDHAVAETARRRPDLAATALALAALVARPGTELARRFMQTTGPVMAKGVEDTAFYRMTRLGTLTEVGGDPSVFALDVERFHTAQARRQAQWPHAMTSLSTHDTKRGEDVRARLSVLAEIPERWAEVLLQLRGVASTGHGPFDSLLWQAIIGAWPASAERLHAYAEKAAREAAERTGWWDPDPAFEGRMHALVDAAFDGAHEIVDSFATEIAMPGWSNSLAAKLVQLTAPGVPDVYQGSELWETSLVDPDNRRPVDFPARGRLLARIDEGWMPRVDSSGAAKLLVVSRALRLRRDRRELFTHYRPVTAVGAASDHLVAFDRGGAITLATRLPVALAARGGWGDTAVMLPAGPWRDEFTGRIIEGGAASVGDVLATYPVALLTPAADAGSDERRRA